MATRILYLTDTHWGALAGAGWTMQPRDPAHFDAQWAALRAWLANHAVDLVLHGGDAVEHGTTAEIEAAGIRLASLGVPTLLCLGNHDVALPTSIADWREHHRGTLRGGTPTYHARHADVDVLVLGHHWNAVHPPHYWDASAHRPVLDDEQRWFVERQLAGADRPVVLAMHGPPIGVPPEQCGRDEEAHAPDPTWRALVHDLVDRYPWLRLILAGHNHTHTMHRRGQCLLMTTASFTETPYEARLITMDARGLDVSTLCFGDLADIAGEYDAARAWVHGGPAQRSCRLAW